MRRVRKPSKALQSRLDTMKTQDWRKKAFKRQEGLCAYCGEEMVLSPDNPKFRQSRQATLDHKMPLARGGDHHWENVVAACHQCNRRKGTMTAYEFCPAKFPAPSCEEAA